MPAITRPAFAYPTNHKGYCSAGPNSQQVNYREKFFYQLRLGNLENVRTLMDENPELTNAREEKMTTPLHVAAQMGHVKIAELLLDRGAQIEAESNATGSTPLKHAVFFAQTKMVKFLLKRGAQVDNPGGTSRTPLELALEATGPMFREMGTPGDDVDYAVIANILRSRSLRKH